LGTVVDSSPIATVPVALPGVHESAYAAEAVNNATTAVAATRIGAVVCKRACLMVSKPFAKRFRFDPIFVWRGDSGVNAPKRSEPDFGMRRAGAQYPSGTIIASGTGCRM
jgi:hypothetical protein